MKGLRERHHLKNPGKPRHPEVGEVDLIKSEDKNRGKWKIDIVTDTIEGRDGVVRAVKLRVGTSRPERAVQHLFPLELSCDQPRAEEGGSTALRTENPEFRPRRDAAVAANLRMRDVTQSEDDSSKIFEPCDRRVRYPVNTRLVYFTLEGELRTLHNSHLCLSPV